MFQLTITRWLTRKLLEVPFKDAIRDQFGNLILKRAKGVRIFVLIGFICGLMGLCIELFMNPYTEEEGFQYIIVVGLATIILGFASLALLHSKTLVEKDGITAYRFYGERSITFDSIYSVTYTRFFSGCAILKGNGIKMLIPLDTCGFYEFYEILASKLGHEKCKAIEKQLKKRQEEISRYA